MPFNIGPGELIIVLVIALIVVGPGKLPDVGAALGKSIKEFRKAATDVKDVDEPRRPRPGTGRRGCGDRGPVATAAATAPAPAASIPTAPPAPNVIADDGRAEHDRGRRAQHDRGRPVAAIPRPSRNRSSRRTNSPPPTA